MLGSVNNVCAFFPSAEVTRRKDYLFFDSERLDIAIAGTPFLSSSVVFLFSLGFRAAVFWVCFNGESPPLDLLRDFVFFSPFFVGDVGECGLDGGFETGFSIG